MVEVGRVTAVMGVDISSIASDMARGKAEVLRTATDIEKRPIKIKTEIDNTSVSGGLSKFMNSEKGKFANVGREMGQSLQMGMQQQFGMMGGMASSIAGALGPAGIVATAAIAGGAVIAGAATKAAMAWEDMKTSIGRTTGLKNQDLESMMDQLQSLRMEYGITREAAAAMVQQAGSIGVGQSKLSMGDMAGYKKEILDFTEATSILQGAWGMSAEATSSGIGKMGSVTLGQWNIQRKARGEEEMSWADYAYKVGGITDNLANAMGSSEEEIVTAMKNSSGAIAKWAPDESTYGKWQAMASFLIDTGASAGEAGTQIERVSQKMEQNGADAAAILGLDQAGMNTKLKADFMGTIQELGTAVAAMPATERPDLFKMFGIEGASMIGKVVADIEAGTGKLQTAFELAAKPGNVAKGYEDVADNASKQFARIGEAFQVSLEKIGGQLLPIVTDIAGGIADAWIAANEKGTELFVAAQQGADKYKNTDIWDYAQAMLGTDSGRAIADQAAYEQSQTATSYIDEFGKEWTGEDFKGKLVTVTKDGVSKGMSEGAKEGAEKAAEELEKDIEAAMSRQKAGVSQLFAYTAEAAIASSGTPYVEGKNTWTTKQGAVRTSEKREYDDNTPTRITDTFDVLGEQYQFLQTETNNLRTSLILNAKTGKWNEVGQEQLVYRLTNDNKMITEWVDKWGKSGKEVSNTIAENYYDEMRGNIKDSSLYMKDQYTKISGGLGNVVADGVFGDMERKQVEVYQSLLELYKSSPDIGINFGVNEQNLLTNVDDILSGKKFAIDVAATINPLYEDFTSAAYREKWKYENKDFVKTLTPQESENWMDMLSYADQIIQNPANYSAEQLRAAQDAKIAMDLAVTAQQDGNVSTSGIWGTSLSILNQFPALISALDRMGANISKSIADNIKSGKAEGSFYPYAYGGEAGSSKRTPISNPFTSKTTTLMPYASLSNMFGLFPTAQEGGYTGDYEGLVNVHKNEMILSAADTKFYSDMWAKDYSDRIRITPPTSMFQSSAKAGSIPTAETGTPIRNPWTDQSILNPAYMQGLQAQYQARGSMVTPSSSLQNPYVADYTQKEKVVYDRWANVKDQEMKAALQSSDMMLKKTAADGKYCEAVSQFAIAQEEATGLFNDAFIGPTKDYQKAIAGGYLNGKGGSSGNLERTWEAIEKNTDKTAKGMDKGIGGFTSLAMLTLSIFRGSDRIQTYGSPSGVSGAGVTRGMTEDIYSAADGLQTCIQYLSDFAIMQEGPLSEMLFEASYIGQTSGWAGAGKGGDKGNYFGLFPTAEPYMKEAENRGFIQSTAKTSEQTAKNTEKTTKELAKQTEIAKQSQAAIQTYGASMGGGSSIMGLANRGGGSYWGGTSINGGGAWVGGGASLSGWGAAASNAASSGGGSSWGSVQWAKGGFADGATFGVFGEAGREAFVPISDRAAGLRILPQVMRELGVRRFAMGGFAGGSAQNALAAIGNVTHVYAPNIQGVGLSREEIAILLEKDHKAFLKEVARAEMGGRNRRSGT